MVAASRPLSHGRKRVSQDEALFCDGGSGRGRDAESLSAELENTRANVPVMRLGQQAPPSSSKDGEPLLGSPIVICRAVFDVLTHPRGALHEGERLMKVGSKKERGL